MTIRHSRFVVVQIAFAALFAAALHQGLLGRIWTADETHLSAAIGFAALAGWVWSWFRVDAAVRELCELLPMLGLTGTVVGFIIALSGIDPSSAGNIAQVPGMVARAIDGMGTAFYTTLIAAIGHVVLRINLALR